MINFVLKIILLYNEINCFMGNDIFGWGKLKEHLRNTNNTNEYYLDDSEHLIIFLNDKMNVQVYGYLIYQNKILPSYAKDILY